MMRSFPRARWAALASILTLTFLSGGWLLRPRPSPEGGVYHQARLFEGVVGAINQHYIDSLGEGDLYQRAADALVGSLHDPYAELLLKDSYRDYQRQMAGTEIDLERGPAESGWEGRAAANVIAPGDEVLSIDGESTKGWTPERIDDALRRVMGPTVTVVVRPRGASEPVVRRFTRTEIHISAASRGVMLDGGVGYVVLRRMSQGAADELRAAVDTLVAQGMTSLVLDLRSNPGGLIREGVAVAGLFLEPGDTVATSVGRSWKRTKSYLAETPLQFTQRIGEVDTSFTAYQGAVYWQDDIRTTRTLTISVGVREELQSLIETKLNLMPRLGLTYSPRNSKTIVRGGYGLFYDWYESNLYDQTLRVNGIAQRDLRINCPGFPDPFAAAVGTACRAGLGAGVPLVQPGGRIQASPNLAMPHVHQASASIERPIGASFRAAAGYQMLRGRNQMRARDVNTPDPITALRPEPAIGSVTQFDSTGRSARDSLNVNIGYAIPRRQINLGMNYTLARFWNHADNATQLPVDSYRPDLEWGPSAQDIRHRLQANLFLPPVRGFRLSLNGLVYQSGAPYNITTGVDDNHDLVINDRPLDATGRVIGRNNARGAARWGDMSMRLGRAFVFGAPTPRAQQQGGPRGGGGGGFQQNAGRFTLEFFAQADNVLNRVNFTSYAGTMTSRLFGQPTAASQARRVQLGFQFRF